MSAPARPSYAQSLASTIALLILCAVTAPISVLVTVILRLRNSREATSIHSQNSKGGQTVLVTGARTVKSLFLARVFWKAGYRVVLADERYWGSLAAARFSRCVAAYYNLPDPQDSHEAYERRIRSIVAQEGVQLWICASSAGATINDARVAEKVRTQDGVQAFIQSTKEAEKLHSKDLFMDLCEELGFAIPEGRLVTTVENAVEFLHSDDRKGRKFIVKTTALDDQGRSDFTRLPFATPAKTRAHLLRMPRKISPKTPYVLQQFIDGFEYCTHCHAIDGKIQSFLACPSSDMVMRYVDCSRQVSETITNEAEHWTRTFLAKWKDRLDESGAPYNLSGHFSFDFIVDKDGTMYPIECNPRVHTAAVLLSEIPATQLAASYFDRQSKGLLVPRTSLVQAYSWLFHSVPLTLVSLLPPRAQQSLHPLLASPPAQSGPAVHPVTLSPQPRQTLVQLFQAFFKGTEVDPMLDPLDPMPFAAQHLTWFWYMFRLVFLEGKGWSRVNLQLLLEKRPTAALRSSLTQHDGRFFQPDKAGQIISFVDVCFRVPHS